MQKNKLLPVLLILMQSYAFAQHYSFDFQTSGRRVCLVSSEVNVIANTVKILFLDSLSHTTEPLYVYRRVLGSTNWTPVATALPAGTGHWIDNNITAGDIWEYQVKRQNTWNFQSASYDATGYTIACLQSDNTNYKGQMILLVANDIPSGLPEKYQRLKKEFTSDGWFVNEIIVPRATSWDSGNEVVTIKNQITAVYDAAPSSDKPQLIFILGHVPLPRCGSTSVVAPDDHDENKGARGCDAFYADIDGVFTDTATYNPGGLATSLAINLPGDFKWDQDFFPSDVEMAFGRIDFANLTDITTDELVLIENYLDRLSHYKNVETGFNMGDKTAFYWGYDNSNDGSYRSLPNLSTPNNLYQNYSGPNHNQWVQLNGPFKVYMQNLSVPEINDWQTYGMNATVYASDQSYWGFGDAPQPNGLNGRIRSLLGIESKCLIALWTTTGINIFHQACTGLSLGESMKVIMNHNPQNQYLEKPPQDFDTPDWWNRTHFAFWGDPTLNLYQIAPPSNIRITEVEDKVVLQWTISADTQVIGYHIFESDSAFGKFERISTTWVTEDSFILPNYQLGKWYMVKAVGLITSGCGKFLHSSLGKDIQGTIVLSNAGKSLPKPVVKVFPNPGSTTLNIESTNQIHQLYIFNLLGEKILALTVNATSAVVDISPLNRGVYILKLTGADEGSTYSTKYIKSE